ncbi:MAG: hypothetical protein WBG26_04010, partial [Candidatus Binataceae bacterium]
EQQEDEPSDHAHEDQDQDDDDGDDFWSVGDIRHGGTGDESLSAFGGNRQARDGQAVADGSQAAAIKRRAAGESNRPLRH